MKIALRIVVAAALLAAAGYWVVTQKILTGEYAYAAEPVAVGQAVPDFKLKDPDGKEHAMADDKGAIHVLVFSSTGCPWSRGAEPGLSALAKEYAPKGVVFYGIDSSSNTTPDEIKTHTAEAKLSYPWLKDQGNVYADALGAKVTPDIYVVGKDGKLAYRGAFDNRSSPENVGSANYVKSALDALLAGKPVEKTKVNAWGCSIQRAPKK